MTTTALAFAACLLSVSPTATPVGVLPWFLTPNSPSPVGWTTSAEPNGPGTFVVRDYHDKIVANGSASRNAAGQWSATLNLPAGYYELELPQNQARFGIVVLPSRAGQAAPFFGIDSALAWLVPKQDTRDEILAALARCGIAQSRDRLSWGQVEARRGQLDFSPRGYDRVWQSYARHDVQLLQVFHDGPKWCGHVGKYPEDLSAAAAAWQTIGRQTAGQYAALEIWNEPDISFSGNLPGDQYASVFKAVAHALPDERCPEIVGGVMATFNRRFLDTAARCGLLAGSDAASFHFYGGAMQIEKLIANFRRWTSDFGQPAKPLWITECGRPWKRGTNRPSRIEDSVSALDIVMKGVESHACGIARYFPFVCPFYEENSHNFGMLGREATPTRSMAAYAQLATVLASRYYVGDWQTNSADVVRARVFESDADWLVVLYTNKPGKPIAVQLGLPIVRAAGIDGRTMATVGDQIEVLDGLAYVWIDRHGYAGERLTADTPARRLSLLAAGACPRRVRPGPVVLRFDYAASNVGATPDGYRLPAEMASPQPLVVRTYSLDGQARNVKITLALTPTTGQSEPAQTVALDGRGGVTARWLRDLTPALAKNDVVRAEFVARDEAGQELDRLSIDLLGEPRIDVLLAQHPNHKKLPMEDASQWRSGISRGGQMQVTTGPGGVGRLAAEFGPGDRWCYPSLPLPAGFDLRGAAGIALRLRCEKPATVRLFLWEPKGVGYLSRGLVPADGKWHTVYLPFDQLEPSSANAPDANGRLDLDQVERISLGFNSDASPNVLEFADLQVLW